MQKDEPPPGEAHGARNATETKPGRAEVAAKLRRIGSLLDLNSVGIAAVLRDPDGSYPGDGLIRLMLLERQDPSVRFAELVDTRLAELVAQLEAGVQALVIEGRIQKVYRVTPRRHLITIATEVELQAMAGRQMSDLASVFKASASVPPDWLGRCGVCGQIFVARQSRQRICRRTEQGRYPCVREARRRRRAARKESAYKAALTA